MLGGINTWSQKYLRASNSACYSSLYLLAGSHHPCEASCGVHCCLQLLDEQYVRVYTRSTQHAHALSTRANLDAQFATPNAALDLDLSNGSGTGVHSC